MPGERETAATGPARSPAWLRCVPKPLRRLVDKGDYLPRIAANMGWLFFDKLVRLALGLVVFALVARYLGPAQFGELSYITAYVALFQSVANVGLDGIVVRDLARDRASAGEILSSAFLMRAALGAVLWLLAIIMLAMSKGWSDRSVLLCLLMGGMLVVQAGDTIDLWFQSQLQSRRSVVAKLVACLLANGIRILLVLIEAPLVAFAALMTIEMLLAAFALYCAYRRHPCGQSWRGTLARCHALLSQSWKLIVASAINIAQARVEYLLIESMIGMAALGQYAVALKFMEVFDMAGTILAASVLPALANQAAQNTPRMMRKVYLAMFALYAIVLLCLPLAWWLMGVLYGAQYAQAQSLMLLLALRPLLAYLGLARGILLTIEHRLWYAPFASAVGAGVAVLSALILIPQYGLWGAVASGTLSYLVSNFALDALFYRSNFMNMVRFYKS